MAHRFERVRMELMPDGSANIGLSIVAVKGPLAETDPDFHPSAQWRLCREAHVHGWDVCAVSALFNAREKDADGAEIEGTSAKEILEAWLSGQRSRKALPSGDVPLPTRKVLRGNKRVDEPIKDVSL